MYLMFTFYQFSEYKANETGTDFRTAAKVGSVEQGLAPAANKYRIAVGTGLTPVR